MSNITIFSACLGSEDYQPNQPYLFATIDEAEKYIECRSKEDWVSDPVLDDDEQPMPYPGNSEDAYTARRESGDDSACAWQVFKHEISSVLIVSARINGDNDKQPSKLPF